MQNIDIQPFPTYIITSILINEFQLQSGRTINKGKLVVVIQEEVPSTPSENHLLNKKQQQKEEESLEPPYPEILIVKQEEVLLEYDLENELRNVCIKIPLLQEISDIPIYNKIVKTLCIKKLGRKDHKNQNVKTMSHMSTMIYDMPAKYNDHRNPIVTIEINGVLLPNTLVDLGAAINAMTYEMMMSLQLPRLKTTPILLEMADKSIVKPIGSLDDIVITIDSWQYPIDFVAISPKTFRPGHPVVLRRPWLETADAIIGCGNGEMIISNGSHNQILCIFPPMQTTNEVPLWLENPYGDEDCMFSLLTLDQYRGLQEHSDDNVLQQFLADSSCINYLIPLNGYWHVFNDEFQETCHPTIFASFLAMEERHELTIELVEIFEGKILHIGVGLTVEQKWHLMSMVCEHT